MTLHADSQRALAELEKLTAGKHKVVFVSGNFNIVHPGHLRLLRFAAGCGDFLVVGVNDRDSFGAIIDEQLRHEGVKSIGMVDYAFILRDRPEHFVERLRPAILVKGKEYETRQTRSWTSCVEGAAAVLFGRLAGLVEANSSN